MTTTAQTGTRRPASKAAEAYFARRDGAIAWRRDNGWLRDGAANPLREAAWRAFRTGALWTVRDPRQAEQRRTLTHALDAAERTVPFGASP